jgi:hypothetical protein
MKTASRAATWFAEQMTAKAFAYFAKHYPTLEPTTFSVAPGVKFDKIVSLSHGGSRSVHCFIDADGAVYKAAGWAAPAKGIRYTSVEAAIEHADLYGRYLYADYIGNFGGFGIKEVA